MKVGFIFLGLVILGPKEPNKQMNIFLRPPMEELKELWQGVDVIVKWNADSTYVLPIDGQSVIIWHMTNLPTGVSMISSIVQYVRMTLMHSSGAQQESHFL
jgi:hypothetical protein